MTPSRLHRRLVPTLSAVGALGAVAATAVAIRVGRPEVIGAVALALSWYVAGWVATRARPDHPEASLLLAAGGFHLGAFGTSAAASLARGRWVPWLGEVAAGFLFAAGFAAMALLFALYPDGRPVLSVQRVFVRVVVALTALAAVIPPLTSTALSPALALRPDAVPAPAGLPLVRWDVGLSSLVPLVLVCAGLGVLVAAARRTEARERVVHAWPKAAAGMLALLLLATPAAVRLVGSTLWSAAFVLAAAVLPWALLAGLVRYRLLAVDVQVTRALARGALVVLVVSCYGLVAAALDDRISPAVAAGVAVVAALTGERLLRRLEPVVDRLVTGGRVRRSATEAELQHAGTPSSPAQLAAQAVRTVARALEVSTVRLLEGDRVVAASGRPDTGPPQLVVPVAADDRVLGRLELGPRHGGWGPESQRWVREVASRVGLLWENTRLTGALAERVAELEASRRRLVTAEEEARRRLERDLHDGVQQQLVALLARLELLRAVVPPGSRQAEVTAGAHELARGSLADLRELARGIRPPLLADHGLVAALESRSGQLPVPVCVTADPRVDGTRFPAEVEGAAYFVALEALTNVLKHADATGVRVTVALAPDGLEVAVTDDGKGFDQVAAGTGLAGMRDRVEALGGALSVVSISGVGTTVTAHLPAEAVDRV